MLDAVSLANTVLQEMWNTRRIVRPMKLQKLMYYTIGFFMRAHEKYLINESFYKWDYGPVIPEIYDLFSKYKHHPIQEMEKGKLDDFYVTNGIEALKTLKDVIEYYGDIPDFKLSDLIMHKHASWRKSSKYGRISEELIKKTFQGLSYGK